MSTALESLLGPPAPGAPAHWRALNSQTGVRLRLFSNAQDDQLMLQSSPGMLPPDDDQAAAAEHWHHTLDHPRHEGVRLSVVLCAGSNRLHLVDVCPRHVVTRPVLLELLDEHCQRHQLWTESLQGPGLEPDAPLSQLPHGHTLA